MSAEQRRGLIGLVTGVAVVLVLACGAFGAAGPLWLRLPLPFGYVMSVCAVWQTAPHFQAGVFWSSPFFSAVVPGTPAAAGCAVIPWVPVLPQRGAVLFP